MSIVKLEIFPLHSRLNNSYGSSRGLVQERACTVIKIINDDGKYGYGEAFGSPLVIEKVIQNLESFFNNKDPFVVPNLMSKVYNELYHTSSKGLLVCALSGIEMAVWDLLGKIVNQPTYQLWGGKVRNTLAPYASTGYMTDSEEFRNLEHQIDEVIDGGFRAIKIKIGRSIKSDIKRVKYVRNRLPDVDIMVDMNGNYTADLAIQSIKNLQDYNVYWFEEPVPPHDLLGYKKIKEACPTATIAAGEAEYTRFGFRDLIQNHLVDVLQPDLTKCGGITEAKAITHMSQANNLRISPHIWGGMIGRAASVHFMMALPYYPHSLYEPEKLYMEYDLGENPLRENIGDTSIFINDMGLIEVEDTPGYGVIIDEELLKYYQIKQGV